MTTLAAAVAAAERAAAVRGAVPTAAVAAAAAAASAAAATAAAFAAATSSAAVVVSGEWWAVGAGVTAGGAVWTDEPDEDRAPAGHASGRLEKATSGSALKAATVSEGMKVRRPTPGAAVARRKCSIAM